MPRDSDRRRMADRVIELTDARLGFPDSGARGPGRGAEGEPGEEPGSPAE
jgi:hypothetical protein